MASKATFDPLTRIIQLTEEPDVDGDVTIGVKTDLYSAGKHDWVASESLRRLRFPITSVGGNPKPGGVLGSTFFLNSDWKIKPYSADHRLIVQGNFYSVDGSDPFLDPACGYSVRIMQEVSNLIEKTQADELIEDTNTRVLDLQKTNNNRITFLDNQIVIFEDDGTTPRREFNIVYVGGKATERVPSG